MDIFVFGSNTQGRHGKGAAYEAMKNHGATYGRNGLMIKGDVGCYGLVTKELRSEYPACTLRDINLEIKRLIECALEHPEHTFICTPFGTGLAGFSHKEIVNLWRDKVIPDNIKLPDVWLTKLSLDK